MVSEESCTDPCWPILYFRGIPTLTEPCGSEKSLYWIQSQIQSLLQQTNHKYNYSLLWHYCVTDKELRKKNSSDGIALERNSHIWTLGINNPYKIL